MPKTKFQSVVFTAMMVFCMVFCMTVYTLALNMGGLSYAVFILAAQEMWVEYLIVFLLIFFLISPEALKLSHRYVNPEKNNPLFTTVATQSFTVMMIVPVITLIAAFLHGNGGTYWFTDWLTTFACCFPAALMLQVFYVGPFVRLIFRTLFRERKTVTFKKAAESND